MDLSRCGAIDEPTGTVCRNLANEEHAKHSGRFNGKMLLWPNEKYVPPKRKVGSRRMHQMARALREEA